MRVRSACLALWFLSGCGIELSGGTIASPDAGSFADAGELTDGAPRPDAGGQPEGGDGGDGGPGADAGDAGLLPPDPNDVAVSYAAGIDTFVYAFDRATSKFTRLKSTACPPAEETAVFSDGSVYITSSTSQDLYRWTVAAGCTSVRVGNRFPFAMGVAPKGTLSATEEVLVGYDGADYVRVDTSTGDVTVVAAGALGTLRPSGDVTAIGQKGYLAAAQNTGQGSAFACAAGGDCVVEVDLKTGKPVKFLKAFTGLGIYGLAHSRGKLLLYAFGQVFDFDVSALTLGPALAAFPLGASFTGAGAPPYPRVP